MNMVMYLIETIGDMAMHQNVYFWKDEEGRPIWKDTLLYAKLSNE